MIHLIANKVQATAQAMAALWPILPSFEKIRTIFLNVSNFDLKNEYYYVYVLH
jgi:hypothetical protein